MAPPGDARRNRPGGSGPTGAGRPQQRRVAGSTRRPTTSSGNRPASHGARIRLVQPTQRLRWLLLSILVMVSLSMGRAVQLQAIDAQGYAADAASQMIHTREVAAQRGTITDRFGTVMAATVPAVRVLADPEAISRNGIDSRVTMTDKQQAVAAQNANALSQILAKYAGGKPADYLPALTAKGRDGKLLRYKVVLPQVDASIWNQINKDMKAGGTLNGVRSRYWYGIYKEDNPRRIYPSGSVGGNLVGMEQAGKGLTGLENELDSSLKGTDGKETYESSVYGRIPLGTDVLIPPKDGTNYTLTVDATMQQVAEAALAKGLTSSGASNGTAIVMNVKTGEVLADASLPGYDPNRISKVAAANSMLNRSVESQYEPGSVEKVLTMAALADKGLVTADTHVVAPAKLASGDGHITDDFSHGTIKLTARGVIAYSSNIGTSLLARQMDKATLVDYLQKFGLGQRTGVELPGETRGILPKPDMADYTRDQISFGQGLAVNAMQMAAAVSGVVNDGVYNPPTLLRSASTSDGKAVPLPAKEPRRIISKEASAQVRDMMESVITLHDDRRIDGYRTIGKSGTAERPDGKGGHQGFTASFALAAPAEDPQLLVYVVIDQPETYEHQGSQVALPVANEVMKLALPRYGVQPSSSKAPDLPLTYK